MKNQKTEQTYKDTHAFAGRTRVVIFNGDVIKRLSRGLEAFYILQNSIIKTDKMLQNVPYYSRYEFDYNNRTCTYGALSFGV